MSNNYEELGKALAQEVVAGSRPFNAHIPYMLDPDIRGERWSDEYETFVSDDYLIAAAFQAELARLGFVPPPALSAEEMGYIGDDE